MNESMFSKIFPKIPALIAAVHVPALPGSPKYGANFNQVIEAANSDAKLFASRGVDGLIIENTHDVPYMTSLHNQPQVTACMTAVCREVRREVPAHIPIGVQILAAANKEALAVAFATGLQFVRVEGFVFGHVADEGWIDGCAGELLRFRRQLGAQDSISVLADIKKKHCSHAITSDLSIAQTAEAAEFFCADGVIVTGSATGHPASADDVMSAQKSTNLPVVVGSGVNINNLGQYLNCDGLIVGSAFKRDGKWSNPIDTGRLDCFMKQFNKRSGTA